MENISIIFTIIVLFYLLGKSADLVIHNIRIIAEKLGIKLFFLGILLGVVTSLPEMALGINAAIDGIPSVSVGNLLGGIIVLFGLVLGVNIVLHQKIVSTEKLSSLFLIFGYFLLPVFMALSGNLKPWMGFILATAYFGLVFYLYRTQKHHYLQNKGLIIKSEKTLKNIFFLAIGIVLVILISNLIIRFTEVFLEKFAISPFVIGLILFSIGTNLPEIIVMLRAWKRKINELSISNLIGSGLANTLFLGFLIMFRPIVVRLDLSFFSFVIIIVILLSLILIFYRTGKHLSRLEGFALLAVYALFVFSQFFLVFLKF